MYRLLINVSLKVCLNYRTRNTRLDETAVRGLIYENESSLFTFAIENDLFLTGRMLHFFLHFGGIF